MDATPYPTPADSSLETIVPQQFHALSECERRLLRAAPEGRWALGGSSFYDGDPDNDLNKADIAWSADRTIRAEIIRWLCVDRAARDRVDPRGIMVYAARITGTLDLSYVSIPSPLELRRCRLADDVVLFSSQLSNLSLESTWVRKVILGRLRVQGYVLLGDGFYAESGAHLVGAQIGGSLGCVGGIFRNPSGSALNASDMSVQGNVYFGRGFRAEGEVVLRRAQIGGDLDCDGGTFYNVSRTALDADGITVRGNVFIRERLHAEGRVVFRDAQIGGDFDCAGSTISELDAGSATIKGNFFWLHMDSPKDATLDLRKTSVGSFADDNESWPKRGYLKLDGFEYGRISSGATDAATRLQWLELQSEFAPQPYRQLAKVLREAGDDGGVRKVLYELDRRQSAKDTSSLRRCFSFLNREILGYAYFPERAIYEMLDLGLLGWIIYRRSYLAGTMIPTDQAAQKCFDEQGKPPKRYATFAPLIYSLENQFPIVKLGQADRWQPEPNSERDRPKVGDAGPIYRLSDRDAWPRGFGWLRRALVLLGLQPGPVSNSRSPRLSRWGTSSRFVRWFLWIQIALGWLLAALWAAYRSGVAH